MKKRNRSNKNDKMKYLKILLSQKGFTLKDLKCEAALMICCMLIDNYLIIEKEGKSSAVIKGVTSNDVKVIFEMMENFQASLYENVLSTEELQVIIDNKSKSQKSLIKYKLIEPLAYFYNVGVNRLKSKIIEQNGSDTNILWIPELIAITLIQDMIEEGYIFTKFPFLEEIDFTRLFDIYIKTNSKLKQTESIKLFSKENTTIISKMQNVSNSIASALINCKYK